MWSATSRRRTEKAQPAGNTPNQFGNKHTINNLFRFLLGTRTNALRYINQFTEIFTEEGRKNVKITHRVPNQQPRVTFTAGMRATMTAAAQAAQASEAAAPAGGGAAAGGGSQAGGGGAPQAAILQSRALVTPPVTVVGQVRLPLSFTGGASELIVLGTLTTALLISQREEIELLWLSTESVLQMARKGRILLAENPTGGNSVLDVTIPQCWGFKRECLQGQM